MQELNSTICCFQFTDEDTVVMGFGTSIQEAFANYQIRLKKEYNNNIFNLYNNIDECTFTSIQNNSIFTKAAC